MGLSLWWSFSLTLIGVTGLIFVYAWKTSKVGPLIGIAAQGLWIAYAVVSGQWWFLASAFAYGGANIYGLWKRGRDAKASGGMEETSERTTLRDI